MPDADPPLLEVTDLRVEFRSGREIVRAVNGATFSVQGGETLAVLGESGSGKSVTAAAIMRLLASPPAHITGGSIRFDGADVLGAPMSEWRKRCGLDIGMVFQDALASLNPVFSVGCRSRSHLERTEFCTPRPRLSAPRSCSVESAFPSLTNGRETTRINSPAACASE